MRQIIDLGSTTDGGRHYAEFDGERTAPVQSWTWPSAKIVVEVTET
jgi:hypothetical protein